MYFRFFFNRDSQIASSKIKYLHILGSLSKIYGILKLGKHAPYRFNFVKVKSTTCILDFYVRSKESDSKNTLQNANSFSFRISH